MAFGRMDSKKGNEPMSDINVTPLVDVMLVLLVIFIITAPILASSVKLDLPKTDAAQPGEPPKAILLMVDKSGQTYIDDQPVAAEALRTRLLETAKAAPDTEVQLRADQGVPYGRVVEVIGDAQKAGLTRIGFMADLPKAEVPATEPAATIND